MGAVKSKREKRSETRLIVREEQYHRGLRDATKDSRQDVPNDQETVALIGNEVKDHRDLPKSCKSPSFDSYSDSYIKSGTKAQSHPSPATIPSTTHPEPSNSGTKMRKPHYYKRTENDEKMQISSDLLPGLLQHCGSYKRTMMRTTLLRLEENRPIDLTQLYIGLDVECKKNASEKVLIQKKELFLQLFGQRFPNSLCLEGPAGSGKSSYLESYAYEWSQDLSECEQKGIDVPCQGHLWKLVVYISTYKINGSAIHVIRESLRCQQHLKDQMMHAIEEDGEGVLIVFDNTDQIRNDLTLDTISSYTKTCQIMVGKPKVLVAAQDGLLPIARRLFDRELRLEGFSVNQGIHYMERYLKEMYSNQIHPVVQYMKADPNKFLWILCNPLLVQINCELIQSESLTLKDFKYVPLNLVRRFERVLLMLCKTYHSPTDQSSFYTACLKCLLTDQRYIPVEMQNDIIHRSPLMSFLQIHKYMDKDLTCCKHLSFRHEVLMEYFAVRGLIQCLKSEMHYKQAILVYLCSRIGMQHIIIMTCNYIAQYEPELLPDVVFIIRACIILQTEHVWCEQNELTQELLRLPDVVQDSFPPNILTDGLTLEQATMLDQIVTQIKSMFTEKAWCLKMTGWFLNGYQRDHHSAPHAHVSRFQSFIVGCLEQLTPDQQVDICSQTTHRLLPTSISDFTIVPVNGIRWAAIEQASLHINVVVWSPCDLLSALNTYSRLPQMEHHSDEEGVTLGVTRAIDDVAYSLFTSVPVDPWSEEQWTPSLIELLSSRYRWVGIDINMGDSTPQLSLSGFLNACCKVITLGHGLIGGLTISYGQVSEEELARFSSWAGGVGLRLQLQDLVVVLRTGRDEMEWGDVNLAIRRKANVDNRGVVLLRPTYILHDGHILDIPSSDISGHHNEPHMQSDTCQDDRSEESVKIDSAEQPMSMPTLGFSGRFTKKGGILKNPGTDVVLTVPAGALPPRVTVAIGVKIHTNLTHYTQWVPNESASILGPVVECVMSKEMTFQNPVTLSVPLCISPRKSSDITVMYSDGDRFKDISSGTGMRYYVEGNILQIETMHFTEFFAFGKIIKIEKVLITLAAKMSTGSCRKLELRPMAHVNRSAMREFADHPEWSYHEDMEIIDNQHVILPERENPLHFPEIALKVWVKEDSAWKVVDYANDDAESYVLEKITEGASILNIANSDSRPLPNFHFESVGFNKQAECRMKITFIYEKSIEPIEPIVHIFDVIYPKELSRHAETHMGGGEVDPVMTAMAIEKDLKENEEELVKSTGIGGLVGDPVFIGYLRSLKILNFSNIEEIEAERVPTGKASKLVRCLLCSKQSQLVLFAWVVIKMRADHHLKGSITERRRNYLDALTKDKVSTLVRSMDYNDNVRSNGLPHSFLNIREECLSRNKYIFFLFCSALLTVIIYFYHQLYSA